MPLRDWNPFARPPAGARPGPAGDPPDLAAALDDLGRLGSARPELADAGRTLAAVLRAAFLPPPVVPSGDADGPDPDPDLLLAAWRAGVPAFRAGDAPPPIDADDLRSRALAVASCLSPGNPHAGPLIAALRDGRADPLAWAVDALADRADLVDAAAASAGLDPPLARSVLRLSLLPVLSARSRRLAPLRPEGAWDRGDCPHCGGPPTLGESRGLEQRRYWRCGVCAADWGGGRLRCPFCGESDHRRLHYRYAEGEENRFRLSLCDACGGGLKVVSTLKPISPPGLLVAELAAAHLDVDPAAPGA